MESRNIIPRNSGIPINKIEIGSIYITNKAIFEYVANCKFYLIKIKRDFCLIPFKVSMEIDNKIYYVHESKLDILSKYKFIKINSFNIPIHVGDLLKNADLYKYIKFNDQ